LDCCSGEDVKMQYRCDTSQASQVGVDQATMVVIKLSDDLVEDIDWYHDEITADTALTTTDTTTNNATVSFTNSVANTPWLIRTKSRVTCTSTSQRAVSRILRSDGASSTTPQIEIEGEDTVNDMQVLTLARVFMLGASQSNTFEEQGDGSGSAAGTRKHSGIFALNLSKLKNAAHTMDSIVRALAG
jgi:hypothetical protein